MNFHHIDWRATFEDWSDDDLRNLRNIIDNALWARAKKQFVKVANDRYGSH